MTVTQPEPARAEPEPAATPAPVVREPADTFLPASERTDQTTARLLGLDVKTTSQLQVNARASENGASLSLRDSFSTALTGARGYGVTFGASTSAAVATQLQTTNGVTRYSVDASASVTLRAGVRGPTAGVTLGHTEGVRAHYDVAMPEAAAARVDPRSVNPFDPSSMPTGTVVTLNGAHNSGNEFKATFRAIAVESRVSNEAGVSVVVAKTGDNTVRVTAGPTEAVQAYNGVGVSALGASISLGRNDRVAGATLRTAEFDLATPEGAAAYNDFLASGALPRDNGAGVSGVATIERLDSSSQTTLGVKLGSLEGKLDGLANTGSRVRTTLPDGTSTVSTDLHYGGNVPLNVAQRFGADGQEILAERRYTYTLTPDQNTAQLLNVAIAGDAAGAEGGPAVAGRPLTMQFTEGEMREYMRMTQRASDSSFIRSPELDALVRDYGNSFVDSPEDFALALARNLNGGDYGQAERMFSISDGADGRYGSGFTRLPGTYTAN